MPHSAPTGSRRRHAANPQAFEETTPRRLPPSLFPTPCRDPNTDVALGARPPSLAAPLTGSNDHQALPVCSRSHRVTAVSATSRALPASLPTRFVNPWVGAPARACLTWPLRILEAPATGLSLFPLRVRSADLAASRGDCSGDSKRSRAPSSQQPLRVGRILLALRLRGRSPALQSLLQSTLRSRGGVRDFRGRCALSGRPSSRLARGAPRVVEACCLVAVRRLAVRSVLQVPLCSNFKDRPGGPGFVFAEPSFVAHGPPLAGQGPTSKKMKSAFYRPKREAKFPNTEPPDTHLWNRHRNR